MFDLGATVEKIGRYWKVPYTTVGGSRYCGVGIVWGVTKTKTSSIDEGSGTSLTGSWALVAVIVVTLALCVVDEWVTFITAMMVQTGLTLCTRKRSTLWKKKDWWSHRENIDDLESWWINGSSSWKLMRIKSQFTHTTPLFRTRTRNRWRSNEIGELPVRRRWGRFARLAFNVQVNEWVIK